MSTVPAVTGEEGRDEAAHQPILDGVVWSGSPVQGRSRELLERMTSLTPEEAADLLA